MKRHWIITNSIALICLLALLIGSGPASSADSVPPQDEILSLDGTSAAMNSAFSYQGVLKNNGAPVNGSRTFVFQLHNNSTCTNQLQALTKTDLPVVEGRFHTSLQYKHSYFNGQQLFLRVLVESTELMCEEIMAVPYALSIMPGAQVDNTTADVTINSYDALKDTAVGVAGSAQGALLNFGLKGSLETGRGAGVYAYSNSTEGSALYARNTQNGVAAELVGDATQNSSANGLVKAGIEALCDFSEVIYHQFGPATITIDEIANGHCELDFGFDLSERYWSVTTNWTDLPRIVTCSRKATDNNVLICKRFTLAGTLIDGPITILIY